MFNNIKLMANEYQTQKLQQISRAFKHKVAFQWKYLKRFLLIDVPTFLTNKNNIILKATD